MKEKELERLTKLKEIEELMYVPGTNYICGIDEAGRGPLAGPVVVAAVIILSSPTPYPPSDASQLISVSGVCPLSTVES